MTIRVAVLGSGNIGSDLCERLLIDNRFELVALVGRSPGSTGLARFKGRIPFITHSGLHALLESSVDFDGCFDATSAESHVEHWKTLSKQEKWVVDLTPSNIGFRFVPAIADTKTVHNFFESDSLNVSMVSCGGQSGAPLVDALKKSFFEVLDVELSSSISAKSAGPATRRNINHYILTTESLISDLVKEAKVKVILVINPVTPPVEMRSTVTMSGRLPNIEMARALVYEVEKVVQEYAPGYQVVVPPSLVAPDTITATVRVTGAGLFLPKYAGNLDIINAAAVQSAYRITAIEGL